MSTLAGSFNKPSGIAVDGGGNVYVAEEGSHQISMITAAGVVSTIAGSGTAGSRDGTGTAALFNQPTGIAIDSSGNIYVADTTNHTIRKLTRD